MTNSEAPRERNPFLEAVGRVTLAGAQLDFSLRGLLGALSHDPTLLMYANAANTSQLLEFCKLALKSGIVGLEDAAEIEVCLRRAEKFRDRRNTIVHALYGQDESGTGMEAMNPARKQLGYHVSAVSVAEMEALADKMVFLQDDLFRAGWNARASRTRGMDRMPPRPPGQAVNGIAPC
ncbi:hypothetical protein ACGFZG_14935 [Streptomyces antibioticus]|uniref:hypothetical protein n=1 Tax=Streptomyces antibioticus TaxID=1890 RepID=UPI0036F88C56